MSKPQMGDIEGALKDLDIAIKIEHRNADAWE